LEWGLLINGYQSLEALNYWSTLGIENSWRGDCFLDTMCIQPSSLCKGNIAGPRKFPPIIALLAAFFRNFSYKISLSFWFFLSFDKNNLCSAFKEFIFSKIYLIFTSFSSLSFFSDRISCFCVFTEKSLTLSILPMSLLISKSFCLSKMERRLSGMFKYCMGFRPKRVGLSLDFNF